MSGGPTVLAGQRVTAYTYNQNVAGAWQPPTLQNGWTAKGSNTVNPPVPAPRHGYLRSNRNG